MSDEERMTRAEWQRLERVETCTALGHEPNNRIATLADRVGFWTCDCGKVTWTPTTR